MHSMNFINFILCVSCFVSHCYVSLSSDGMTFRIIPCAKIAYSANLPNLKVPDQLINTWDLHKQLEILYRIIRMHNILNILSVNV